MEEKLYLFLSPEKVRSHRKRIKSRSNIIKTSHPTFPQFYPKPINPISISKPKMRVIHLKKATQNQRNTLE
jgi:hypothetical protein